VELHAPEVVPDAETVVPLLLDESAEADAVALPDHVLAPGEQAPAGAADERRELRGQLRERRRRGPQQREAELGPTDDDVDPPPAAPRPEIGPEIELERDDVAEDALAEHAGEICRQRVRPELEDLEVDERSPTARKRARHPVGRADSGEHVDPHGGSVDHIGTPEGVDEIEAELR
jgi:hypothetical protein